MLEVMGSCILVTDCLARCLLLKKGARHSSERQAIVPARYDEGTIASKHKAATEERGYRITTSRERAQKNDRITPVPTQHSYCQ